MVSHMEWISGGYYLTKRTSCRNPGTNFVTLSPDDAYFFPDSWAIAWCNEEDAARAHCATALGISESALPTLIPQITELFEKLFGWPNVMPSTDAAQAMLRLLPPSDGWLLLGVGIPSWERVSISKSPSRSV